MLIIEKRKKLIIVYPSAKKTAILEAQLSVLFAFKQVPKVFTTHDKLFSILLFLTTHQNITLISSLL